MSDRSDPFGDIERLFDELGTQFGAPRADLAVDIIDEGDGFRLRADLPGYDADDIDLQITDGRRVHIEATRSTETEETGDTFVTRERRKERVSRSVRLPEPVDESATAASYDAGVLEVELPKRSVEEAGTDIPVS